MVGGAGRHHPAQLGEPRNPSLRGGLFVFLTNIFALLKENTYQPLELLTAFLLFAIVIVAWSSSSKA